MVEPSRGSRVVETLDRNRGLIIVAGRLGKGGKHE
jgi:hypothetical protein